MEQFLEVNNWEFLSLIKSFRAISYTSRCVFLIAFQHTLLRYLVKCAERGINTNFTWFLTSHFFAET